jgi:hypothetical protein
VTRAFPAAVESEADLPKFCGHCGRGLLRKKEPGAFDRMTGRQFDDTPIAECPRYGGNSFHEAFIVSPRPRPSLPPANPALMGTKTGRP